jgi:hypothetical protein
MAAAELNLSVVAHGEGWDVSKLGYFRLHPKDSNFELEGGKSRIFIFTRKSTALPDFSASHARATPRIITPISIHILRT